MSTFKLFLNVQQYIPSINIMIAGNVLIYLLRESLFNFLFIEKIYEILEVFTLENANKYIAHNNHCKIVTRTILRIILKYNIENMYLIFYQHCHIHEHIMKFPNGVF